MSKLRGIAVLMSGLGLALVSGGQTNQQIIQYRQACVQRCATIPYIEPEMQRQEIVSLERETARAIQLNNGAFFRRVYSDDFAGTLSHGQQVNKTQWLTVIQSNAIKYDAFQASDIRVQIYQDMAVATSLWSSRFNTKGQPTGHQMRAIHVYLNGASGWHVVSGQITSLPPDVGGPL